MRREPIRTAKRAQAAPAGRALPLLAAAGAIATAAALGWSNGLFHPVPLALVTLATGASAAALAFARARPAERYDLRWTDRALGAAIALSLAFDAAFAPGLSLRFDRLGAFRPLLAVAAALAATYAWRDPPALLARLRFPLIVLAAAALGALVIRASPSPGIDVWLFQQFGAEALANGYDPYTVGYTNIYGPYTHNYSAAVLSTDRTLVLANPYPPLTLLLALPAVLAGLDVRWALLGCVVVSAWALRRLGRGAATAELAAILLVLQPRAFYVLELAWTEPTVLAATLVALVAVDAWARRGAAGGPTANAALGAGLAGALALASKQYAVLLLVPLAFAAPARHRRRAILVALAGAAATLVPFAVVDAASLVRSLVGFHLAQPFRADALSWPAAVVRMGGPALPVWPAFLLAAAVVAIAARRPVSTEGALAAAATAW
ncbi:MAG TPA: hypothetical protein VF841_16085, partial [Anaeromyxobacter sp.]